MSLFGRALAGAGQGASEIANKYIDAEIANSRAQVLADIQRTSTVQTHQQLDQYDMGDARQAKIRSNAAAGIVSTAAATDTARLATASNAPLTAATIAQDNAMTAGTAPAKAAATALTERARAENAAHDVAPGGKVIIGAGQNDNPTAGQIQADLYERGLKGARTQANKEQRDRAYEAILSSTNKELDTITQQINRGIADGTIKKDAPDPKTHWFGPDEPGKDPAYSAYQELRAQQNALRVRQKQISDEMRSGMTRGEATSAADAPPSTDPYGGVRKPAAGGGSMGGGETRSIPTNVQASRDAEGGRLRVNSEFGGSVERAKAGLKEIDDAIAKAPRTKEGNDAIAMLKDQRSILAAGIAAKENGAPLAPTDPGSGSAGPPPRPLAERAAAANSATAAATSSDSPVIAASRAAAARDTAANAAAVPGKPAGATDPGPQPTRNPSETFSQYRQRILDWTDKREAFLRAQNDAADAARKAQEELVRQAEMAKRPYLANGGLMNQGMR